mgnify:CR=1 FL=1
MGVRCHRDRTITPHPLTLRAALRVAPEPSLTLGFAQALSRRERDAMRHVCQKSAYRRYSNPLLFNHLPFSPRKIPALVPARAIIPLSRRTGGSLGRRSAAAAGADGAGATRSQTLRGRLPRGCEVEPGGRPDGPGAGRSTRTGPGDGRCHPCPPRADGPLVKSDAHGLGTVETRPRGASDVRRNGIYSTHRACARRSANAPHRPGNPRGAFAWAQSRRA